MGDASGTESTPPGRAREIWLKVWRNRTKIAGYAGVVSGAVQMAVAAGQHWPMLLLGALVSGIGHYNDQHPSPP